MHSIDPRGSDLRAFDTLAGELSHHYRIRFEAGGSLASRDIQRIGALAERIGRELMAWCGAVRDLEAAATAPLEPRRAGRLLIACVRRRLTNSSASKNC